MENTTRDSLTKRKPATLAEVQNNFTPLPSLTDRGYALLQLII